MRALPSESVVLEPFGDVVVSTFPQASYVYDLVAPGEVSVRVAPLTGCLPPATTSVTDRGFG
jgi:hypothetical protein